MSQERLNTLKALLVRERRWLLEEHGLNDPENERHDHIDALEFAILLVIDKIDNPSCHKDTHSK